MSTRTLNLPEANILRRHWDSFEQFVDDLRAERRMCPLGGLYSVQTNQSEWAGSASWESSMNMADHGWPDGLKRMEALRGKLRQLEPQTAERHIGTFCESGDDVDIGRFLSGEPECMIEYALTTVPASGRVVKLLVNSSASCGISPEAMFRRGAAAVMLADMIEQSGLRAEVVVCGCGEVSGGGDYGVFYTVTVKRADQPLELDRLAFMLANPSVFRRLFFRAFEHLSDRDFMKYVGPNYTRPMNPPAQGDGVVLVDAMQYGFGDQLNSEQECIAFVNKMVERFTEKEAA